MMARAHRRRAAAQGRGGDQRSGDGAGRGRRLSGAAQLEPAARHQPDGTGARRRSASPSRRPGRSRSDPAVREALRRPRERSASSRSPTGMLQLSPCRSCISREASIRRVPRHAERRLPARRRAGGAAEGDHRQRGRVRHGRPDPRDDAARGRPSCAGRLVRRAEDGAQRDAADRGVRGAAAAALVGVGHGRPVRPRRWR